MPYSETRSTAETMQTKTRKKYERRAAARQEGHFGSPPTGAGKVRATSKRQTTGGGVTKSSRRMGTVLERKWRGSGQAHRIKYDLGATGTDSAVSARSPAANPETLNEGRRITGFALSRLWKADDKVRVPARAGRGVRRSQVSVGGCVQAEKRTALSDAEASRGAKAEAPKKEGSSSGKQKRNGTDNE